MSRKIQPVSFDLTDEWEKGLYEYATKGKFSPYIKRLIDRDKEGWGRSFSLVEREPPMNEKTERDKVVANNFF